MRLPSTAAIRLGLYNATKGIHTFNYTRSFPIVKRVLFNNNYYRTESTYNIKNDQLTNILEKEQIESEIKKQEIIADSEKKVEDNDKSQEADELEDDWYVDKTIDEIENMSNEAFVPRWLKASRESSKNQESISEYTTSVEPSFVTPESLLAFFKSNQVDDVTLIDMRDKCDWTDTMFIVSGQSLRQINALASSTKSYIKSCQLIDATLPKDLALEGEVEDDWVVLDCGKVVVHFMTIAAKETYKLEELWKSYSNPSLSSSLLEEQEEILPHHERSNIKTVFENQSDLFNYLRKEHTAEKNVEPL